MASRRLPTGTVTFLFTDIEASSLLFEQAPQEMMRALVRHDAIIENSAAENHGSVVRPRGEGDSRFIVFAEAVDAVAAIVLIQQKLAAEPWETPRPLKVRAALHTGEADLRQGDYYGAEVNRCARLRGVGHGGQTLLSGVTWALVQDDLPPGVSAQDMGEHRLRDLSRPEHIYQLDIPDLPHEFPPLRSLSVIPNNLPVQLTEFIGREEAVAETRRSLERTRLLTLAGPGGIGKSRLAIEAAAKMAGQFRHGVFFIPLAPVPTADAVAQAMAEGIGLSLASNEEPQEQLLNFLRGKQQLLVVDNFEHVIDAARLVGEILVGAPDVKVLATSRIRLNLSGETVFSVRGLKTDGWDTAESALDNEAVQLFLSTARRARPDFAIGRDALAPLKKIVELVQGSPLGILLAASWVDMLPLHEIASEIAQNFDFLETDLRDVPQRQRSIRAVFDTTWSLLTRPEQELFAALSVFRGGFTRQAAQKVAGASLRQLANLANKSLLSADPQTGQYAIHELLRQYGEESLRDNGERYAAVREAHALFYARFMDQAWQRNIHGDQIQALLDIDADIENVRAAWRTLVTEGDPQEALRMIRGLWFIYEIRGWHVAGAKLFQEAAQAARARPVRHDMAGQAMARHACQVLAAMCTSTQGWFTSLLGAVGDALALGDQATAELRALDSPDNFAFANGQLCLGLYFTAQLARMKEVGFAALDASDDPWNVMWAHSWIAFAAQMEGNSDEAEKHRLSSEEILGSTSDYWMSYWIYLLRYLAAWEQGDVSWCRQILEEVLVNLKIIDWRRGVQYSLQLLAIVAMALEDYAAARRYLLESLQVIEEIGAIREKVSTLVDLASALAADGRPVDALELAATAYAHPISYQNSGWNMAPIRSRAEELQSSLSEVVAADEAAAAWNRGLTADFDSVVVHLIEGESI